MPEAAAVMQRSRKYNGGILGLYPAGVRRNASTAPGPKRPPYFLEAGASFASAVEFWGSRVRISR